MSVTLYRKQYKAFFGKNVTLQELVDTESGFTIIRSHYPIFHITRCPAIFIAEHFKYARSRNGNFCQNVYV